MAKLTDILRPLLTRVIETTAPLSGGGSVIGADRTIAIPAATNSVDGYLTKEDRAAFNAKQSALGFTPLNVASDLSDVHSVSTSRSNLGVYSTTETDSAISAAVGGAGAAPTSRLINTTSPVLGGGDLSADRTISMHVADATHSGYLSSADWITYDGYGAAIASNASGLATLGGTVTSLIGTVAVNTSDISTNASAIALRLIASNNLSDLANTGTARTNLGLVIGTNVQAWSANLDSWSALATSAKLTTASNLSDLANAGTARTNLGLVIGTNVQAWSSNLDSWSALATSAKLTTASNLSDLANAGTARTNLGLVIGTNVEAWSANLDSWSALATSTKLTTASNLSDVPSPSTARTNLGVAIGTDVAAQGLFATAQTAITNLKKTNIVFVIDGGGSVITTGSKGLLRIPAAMTITGWEMFADASGSIVVDVKKATYSGLPTTTSIAASALPTLSSVQKNTDSTLTGWTTAVSDGDWIEFSVNSATTVKRVTLAIFGNRT